jgi:hypothetical protein
VIVVYNSIKQKNVDVALVRWCVCFHSIASKDKTMLSLADFLPAAEDTTDFPATP